MEASLIEQVIERSMLLWETFLHEPKVYFAIIGEWFLTVLYLIITEDKESHADVYAAGVTLGFIGFELMPFHDFYLFDTTVILSVCLMVYGLILIILAATQILPGIFVKILGMPSMIAIPAMIAILYFESEVPIDMLTFWILATPVLFLELIKILRQHTSL